MAYTVICVLLAHLVSFATALPKAFKHHDGCASLGEKKNEYVTRAEIVSVGALLGIAPIAAQNLTESNTGPFCRVVGRIPYGANNTLNFEVWLPEEERYNHRYLSVGNGGFAGTIDYAAMVMNLNTGFAVGGCDSGHLVSENGPSKPGAYVPFLNSIAETTAWIRDSIAIFSGPAKAITSSFYNCEPEKSYYSGCSTGGAQGYALAQYHPDVFDGIVAGSAGNWYTHLILSFLWNGLRANDPGAFLEQDVLVLATAAAVKHCDSIDGVLDGVIDDPTDCDFDIVSLQCQPGQIATQNNRTACLNETQIATFKAFYAGPGADVYPGFAVGSESKWLAQEEELYTSYAVPILQNLVFKDLNYDYTTFDFQTDVKIVDGVAGSLITATSPRLDAFRARGGKLVATQGWADPYNAPTWPIEQHNEAEAIYGAQNLKDFWRLFMVPGGGHCGSAASYPQVPGTYHSLEALISWVEYGKAPDWVLATNPADGTNTTKKLCPYPEHAILKDAFAHSHESFICIA